MEPAGGGLAGLKVSQGSWPPPKPADAGAAAAAVPEKKRRRSSNMVIDFEEFSLLVSQELEVLAGGEIAAGLPSL